MAAVDECGRWPRLGAMVDNSPPYLRLTYQEWFDNHPGALAEMSTTTVREQRFLGGATEHIKNRPSGVVKVTKEEFDARYWTGLARAVSAREV